MNKQDLEWWEQIQNGKQVAFNHLFRHYYPLLCRYARNYLQNTADCEEVVQGLFIYLWESKDKITIVTSLKSYLYQATRNRCLNHLKHLKVRSHHQEELLVMIPKEALEDFNRLEYEELTQQLEETIETLPERCREVFKLSRFEDKKYQEIATDLNISVKTVEAQMGKALRVLRKVFGR